MPEEFQIKEFQIVTLRFTQNSTEKCGKKNSKDPWGSSKKNKMNQKMFCCAWNSYITLLIQCYRNLNWVLVILRSSDVCMSKYVCFKVGDKRIDGTCIEFWIVSREKTTFDLCFLKKKNLKENIFIQ